MRASPWEAVLAKREVGSMPDIPEPVLLEIVYSFFHEAGWHHSRTTVFQMDQPVYGKRLPL